MSTISEKTDKLFMDATLSEQALGYPDDVAFLPGDEDWAEDALWRNLTDGIPTVLVGEETELLLTPLHRTPLDRLRGQVPVSVAQRVHRHATAYATRSRLGRHPMREMRQLALA
jgi:hypothetical protein